MDTTECESPSQPKWPDHYSPLEQRQMIVIAFWKWSWNIQKFKYTFYLHMCYFSVSPLCAWEGWAGNQIWMLHRGDQDGWTKDYSWPIFLKIFCVIHNKTHIWRLQVKLFSMTFKVFFQMKHIYNNHFYLDWKFHLTNIKVTVKFEEI